MGRGRDQFARFEPLLTVLERLLGRLPGRIRLHMLTLSRGMAGRVGLAIRFVILRNVTRSCGRVVGVFEDVYLRNPENLSLGNNVSIHPMCYIDAEGGLEIGSDVSIAHGVTIMTTEHPYAAKEGPIRDAPVHRYQVRIGNDVWIAAGVKILAGVTIGDHVVIGAGAVVTKDVPSSSLALGVPARVVKYLDAVE